MILKSYKKACYWVLNFLLLLERFCRVYYSLLNLARGKAKALRIKAK
ncbi:hypothetical protein DB41_KP00070 [Neochlamydia sp. TUME1]|nr:hypothetical protein DB41_KP00070 [Neochlamydia sp. TUME1]